MAQLIDLALVPALDADGNPVAGAQLHFYLSGTDTAATVYTTDALNVGHPSPLLSNSAGRFAPVYVTGTAELRATVTIAGSIVRDVDPINPALLASAIDTTSGDTVQEALDGLQEAISNIVVDVSRPPYNAIGNGTANDTAAFQAAIDAVSAAGGGTVTVPAGRFRVANLLLKSNVRLIGAGKRATILHLLAGSNAGSLPVVGVSQTQTTADVANNARGIEVAHIELRGNVDTEGLAEFCHNIRLGGVTDAWFHDLLISRFSGDGFYLGSGEVGGTERHNENVIVERCIFDGFNNNNRNGISIVDGSFVKVRDSLFINCSRPGSTSYVSGVYDVMSPTAGPGMPGSIDIEPDDLAFARIRDVKITGNTIYNAGGNFGKIGVLLPRAQASMTIPVQDILIADNWIVQGSSLVPENLDTGITVVQREAKSASTIENNVQVLRNTVVSGDRGFDVRGVRGVIISQNRFDRQGLASLVGFTNALDTTYDVTVENNTFYECGTVSGQAIQLNRSALTLIERNAFDNIGKPDNSLGQCVQSASGASGIKVIENDFISRGRTTTWVAVESAAAETNEARDNTFTFTGSAPLFDFRAMQTDILDTNATVPGFTLATLPDAFPVGTSVAYVNNDAAAPSTVKFGVLKTERYFGATGTARRLVTQTFTPVDGDDELFYTRKGDSASNAWLAWRAFTGV